MSPAPNRPRSTGPETASAWCMQQTVSSRFRTRTGHSSKGAVRELPSGARGPTIFVSRRNEISALRPRDPAAISALSSGHPAGPRQRFWIAPGLGHRTRASVPGSAVRPTKRHAIVVDRCCSAPAAAARSSRRGRRATSECRASGWRKPSAPGSRALPLDSASRPWLQMNPGTSGTPSS